MQINISKESVNVVLVGRILAGIIIAIGLMKSIYFATGSGPFNGFWGFLSSVVGPLAFGFLILMVTEVLRALRDREW